jgi:hypothetical protein
VGRFVKRRFVLWRFLRLRMGGYLMRMTGEDVVRLMRFSLMGAMPDDRFVSLREQAK